MSEPISGGTISSFSGSGTDFTVGVTTSADVTLNVAAGVFTDAEKNPNVAATELALDGKRPTVTLGTPKQTKIGAKTYMLDITLSEAPGNGTSFTKEDLGLSSTASVSKWTENSSTSYTAELTISALGTVTVDVAAGVFTDARGNKNEAASRDLRS